MNGEFIVFESPRDGTILSLHWCSFTHTAGGGCSKASGLASPAHQQRAPPARSRGREGERDRVRERERERLVMRAPDTGVTSVHAHRPKKTNARLACSLVLFLHKILTFYQHFSLFIKQLLTCNGHGFNTRKASHVTFTLPLPRTNALERTVI